ncbi:MAG: hypothetical protein FH748_00485 [Balneolaceae bacterium]|nr:hypothetical protein [Balneolaceae bacterium]
MKPKAVDKHAKKIATKKFGLPPCVHIPVAARTEEALHRYIGNTTRVLAGGKPKKALLINCFELPPKNIKLPIWELENSKILRKQYQVWVHVDYSEYRRAYLRAFPDKKVSSLVLDHVLNRRVARLKDFRYLRIVPISRAANSSSGGLSEKWAVEYHSSSRMKKINENSPVKIQYADLADIVKMLDIKTGGKLQKPVNEAQYLVDEP